MKDYDEIAARSKNEYEREKLEQKIIKLEKEIRFLIRNFEKIATPQNFSNGESAYHRYAHVVNLANETLAKISRGQIEENNDLQKSNTQG